MIFTCVCMLLVNFLFMASLGVTSADTEELLEYIKEFPSCVRELYILVHHLNMSVHIPVSKQPTIDPAEAEKLKRTKKNQQKKSNGKAKSCKKSNKAQSRKKQQNSNNNKRRPHQK